MPFLFANNVSTTLNGAILAAETTITVTSGAVFPTPVSGFTLRATLVRASDGAVELIDITGISTNDLTVVRAREGTTALDFADGDVIEMRISKKMLEAFPQLDKNNEYTKGQSGPPLALTDGATITPDFADRNNFSLLIAGSRTMANPDNLTAGQSGVIYITKTNAGDALAYGTYWPTSLDDFASMTVGQTGAIYYSVISATAIDASTKVGVGP